KARHGEFRNGRQVRAGELQTNPVQVRFAHTQTRLNADSTPRDWIQVGDNGRQKSASPGTGVNQETNRDRGWDIASNPAGDRLLPGSEKNRGRQRERATNRSNILSHSCKIRLTDLFERRMPRVN